MSYTNPQIFTSDPTAFSKGFEASFQKFQDAFEAERKEKERIAKEKDEALAQAYNASDISDVVGLDTRIMDGIQKSMDAIIDRGDFANASASEQAKMLRKVSSIKNTVSRLGDLASIDPNDWDSRNSDKLTELKNAMLKGDKSIRIEGTGLDLKIVGDFGEVSLDELSSAKFMKKSDYSPDYDAINSQFRKNADEYLKLAVQTGTSLEDVKSALKMQFTGLLQNESDPELLSYLFSNNLSNDTKLLAKGRYYGDPEVTKNMSSKEASEFYNRQFTLMADELADKAIKSVFDYSPFAKYYQDQINIKEQELALEQYKATTQRMSASKENQKSVTERNWQITRDSSEKALSMTDQVQWFRDLSSMALDKKTSPSSDTELFRLLQVANYSIESPIKDEETGNIIGYTITPKAGALGKKESLILGRGESSLRATLKNLFQSNINSAISFSRDVNTPSTGTGELDGL